MKSFKAIFRRGQNSKFDGGDNLSRTSSSTTLDSDQRSSKGTKSKKDSSRERVDRFVENKDADKKVFPKIDKAEPDDDPYPSIDSLQEEELPQLRKKLQEMAQEKSSLALQLGEQKGQLKQLQNEIQMLKEESNIQLEHLTEENATLRNRLRDVVHSPLSDNEKQQLLFDTQRQHSSAPSSIAANLVNEGNGGDSSAYSTPDWDKHSSSNASEVSVACLQDKINQMQETHYSTNEELQATLQELTDLQRQLTELQQENERLNEEKTLMFDSLCRQTERLNDSRSEVESLKQLLYREKEEAEHFEPAVEREQTLVELLKSVQEEREELLLKIEQLNNDLQEAGAAIEAKDDRIIKLSERIRTLECTLDAKQAEQKLLDQELVQTKHQCNGKQIEINRLTDLLDNARTKISELEQDRALIDKSELDELLDIARKEKDSLESELAHLKEQLALSKNEIEKLKEQVYVLQEECKVTRNNARTTQSDLEYKCEKLLKEKNSLNSQLQEYQEALNELQVQSQCQLDDKRQLSAVLSETQRNLNETERKNLNLHTEVEELRKLRAEENEEWEKFQNDLLTSVRVANDFKTEAQLELQRMILENKSYRDRERQLRAEIEKLKGDKTSDERNSNYYVSPGGKISAKDFVFKLPSSRRNSKLLKVEEHTNENKTTREKADLVTDSDKKPAFQGMGLKVRKREKKLPKRRLKSLSVEEEMLLKCLNNFYENIDRNKPATELNKSEKAIVTLKELFDDESLKIKPSATKPKDQLAISKPLLDSVFKNPKLRDVILDPNISYVDVKNLRTASSSSDNVALENINLDSEIYIAGQEDIYIHSSSESLLEEPASLNLYRSPVVIDLTSEVPVRVIHVDPDLQKLEPAFSKKAKSVDNINSKKRKKTEKRLSEDLSVSLPVIEPISVKGKLRKKDDGPSTAPNRITKSYDDISFTFDTPLYTNSDKSNRSSSETFSSAELNLDTGRVSYNLKTGEFILEENKMNLVTSVGDGKRSKTLLDNDEMSKNGVPKHDSEGTSNAETLNYYLIENSETEIGREDSYSSITNKFRIIKRLISEDQSSLPELHENVISNEANQKKEDTEVPEGEDTSLDKPDAPTKHTKFVKNMNVDGTNENVLENFKTYKLETELDNVSLNATTVFINTEEKILTEPLKNEIAHQNHMFDSNQQFSNNELRQTSDKIGLKNENGLTELEISPSLNTTVIVINTEEKILTRPLNDSEAGSENPAKFNGSEESNNDQILQRFDENDTENASASKGNVSELEIPSPLNTTVFVINTQENILTESLNNSKIVPQGHVMYNNNGYLVNNEILQAFGRNSTENASTSKEPVSEELKIYKLTVEPEVEYTGRNTVATIIKPEETFFLEEANNPESEISFLDEYIQPIAVTVNSVPKNELESESDLLTNHTKSEGKKIVEDEMEFSPSEATKSYISVVKIGDNSDKVDYYPRASDVKWDENKQQKVDITQRFFTSIANSVVHKSSVEESTCEFTMLFEDESMSSGNSEEESDSEYNYKNILRENRVGVTSPLNIRMSYRDVVKEIKRKFRRHSDGLLEHQNYEKYVIAPLSSIVPPNNESLVNDQDTYKTLNNARYLLPDTSDNIEINNTQSAIVQTEDLHITDEPVVDNSYEDVKFDINISNRPESSEMKSLPDINEINYTQLNTPDVKILFDLNYGSTLECDKNNEQDDTLMNVIIADSVDRLSNQGDINISGRDQFNTCNFENDDFEKSDSKSQDSTLNALATANFTDKLTGEKDVVPDEESYIKPESTLCIQTSTATLINIIPELTQYEFIINTATANILNNKTELITFKPLEMDKIDEDMQSQKAADEMLEQDIESTACNQYKMYPESPSLEIQDITNLVVSLVDSDVEPNKRLVKDIYEIENSTTKNVLSTENKFEQLGASFLKNTNTGSDLKNLSGMSDGNKKLKEKTENSMDVSKNISDKLKEKDVIVKTDSKYRRITVSSGQTASSSVKDFFSGVGETRPSLVKSQYITKRQSYPTLDRQLLRSTKKVTTFAQHFERMSTDLTSPNKPLPIKELHFEENRKKPAPSPRSKYLVTEESDRTADDSLQKMTDNQNFCEKNQYQTTNSKFSVSQTFGPHGSIHHSEMIKANTENSGDTLKIQKTTTAKSDHNIKKDDEILIHRAQPFSSIPGLGGVENLDKFPRSHPNNFIEPSTLPTTSLYLEAVSFKPTYSDIPRPIENKIYDNFEVQNNPNLPNFEELGSNPKEVEESLDSLSYSNLEFVPLDESTRPVFDKNVGLINNFLLHEKAQY